MCGIFAYIGYRDDAANLVLKGLKTLEYRGYDSWGIAVKKGEKLDFEKHTGKIGDANTILPHSNLGIGHTRWATHGGVTDKNAHPHLSKSGKIAIIHNGIIENYAVLKKALIKEGHTFTSDTDTEVLAHLIETVMIKDNLNLLESVRETLTQVIGAYAIVVMDENNPDTLVVARRGSPLVIGIDEQEFFVASDASPIVEYTKSVIYLDDNQIAILKRDGEYSISSIEGIPHTPFVDELSMKAEVLEKNGYDHYMQKEIFEQTHTINDALRGHILPDHSVHLRGLEEIADQLATTRRLIIVACGTSWISGLVGEYLIESLARMPVEVEYASKFRYRNPILSKHDIVIAISQSGETADTLAALSLAKECGAVTYGICNVIGSSIARTTDAGSYIHVGPEIGVASTKAFTGQVVILSLLSLLLSKMRDTLSEDVYVKLVDSLSKIGEHVDEVLKEEEKIKEIAKILKDKENALFLGRGILFPVALEGAIKLKEISYIHAEGYPAAEMKHGPIALVEKDFPVIIVATNESLIEKVISNVQEVKARGALTIGIVRKSNKDMRNIFDHIIEIPDVPDEWMPILSVIPLQLLAYHTAILRGSDVDKPRNLAKSVTVE